MTYEEIISKRAITDEEAKSYYGKDCYNILKNLYQYCKDSGFIIYQHATSVEFASDIMTRGFITSRDDLEYLPAELLDKVPDDIEYTDEGVKISIFNGRQRVEPPEFSLLDALSNGQHFLINNNCKLDFAQLNNPRINRSNFGATSLFIVSKDFQGLREYTQYGIIDAHYDNWDDEDVPETFFERDVVPKQFCIGYLDVENKTFVFNPAFQLGFGTNNNSGENTISILETILGVKIAVNDRSRK